MDYSYKELIAIVLAREIKDGEFGTAGAGGAIPLSAMLLAQKTHAPNLTIGGDIFINPHPKAIFPTILDDRTLAYCEGIEGFWELFGHSHHGLDFFFHSGIQIDQYGNINLHLVGDIEKPTFRGPGVANVSFGSSSKRIFLYTEKVTRRLFVPKVDFVSIPGHLDGPESKKLMGCKVNSGPCLCVTPMAVFDFDESTLRMRVRSVHKGYTLEELLENIGFTPLVSPNVTITPEPTEEELYHLRNIDKIGLLQ